MKNLLRLEELAQFLACLLFLVINDVDWWYYLLLLLGPDVGMLGYLASPRIGAITYNALHHKGIAIIVLVLGIREEFLLQLGEFFNGIERDPDVFLVLGLILYGHASMDRIFSYGLKFGDNFHHTHLGWIGKGKGQ